MRPRGLSLMELLAAMAILALVVTGASVFLQSNLLFYRKQIAATRLALLCQDWLRSYPPERGSVAGSLAGYAYSLDVESTPQPAGYWLHLTFREGTVAVMSQSLWRTATRDRVLYQDFKEQSWVLAQVDGPATEATQGLVSPLEKRERAYYWKGHFLRSIDDGILLHPVESPDGQKLAYVVMKTVEGELWVQDARGKSRQCWMRGPLRDAPTWLNGEALVVCLAGEEFVEVSSRGQRFLLRGDGLSAPAASPEGRIMAYVGRDRESGTDDIFVLDLKTRKTRNLTRSEEGEIRPLWSSDGSLLLFGLVTQGKGHSLYCMRANGSGLQDLEISASGLNWRWFSK